MKSLFFDAISVNSVSFCTLIMVVLVYLIYPKYLDSDLDALSAADNFCCLLITFVNSLDPDQAPQKNGPDLDPNCLTP